MIPVKPQTIRSSSGEEMVVLTRAEFDALARAASGIREDAGDIAMFDARLAALKAGADVALPAEVSAAMLRGDTLLRAVRRWKDVTQSHLAHRTGLAQGYLSDLEAGRKTGSPVALRKIARALKVDPAWFGA
jgi:DNA-binding XRE family transcriptional regulator